MPKFTAQIHYKDDNDFWSERMTISPIFTGVTKISDWVRKTVDDKDNIREVCVMQLHRGGKTKIHGFYEWKSDRLWLDTSKPAFVHNAFYGLD